MLYIEERGRKSPLVLEAFQGGGRDEKRVYVLGSKRANLSKKESFLRKGSPSTDE